MPEIVLPGCRTDPLMSYLKSLGVLRLVAEQKARGVRARWRGGVFVLDTDLSRKDLVAFFIDDYSPTPIVAPWAGGCGFFKGDNKTAVDAIAASSAQRVRAYRDVVSAVRRILKDAGQASKPSGDAKERLVQQFRRELADSFVEWMDCALVLQADGAAFPPLMGTGGNDGRLDFTHNFMQRIVELGLADEEPVPESHPQLEQALFGSPSAGMASAAIGQFDPGRAGGPNATQGMEGDSRVNPWDYVLMVEGALILAGSVARRMGSDRGGRATFPFTVTTASSVGYTSASVLDAGSARGEIWLPVWTAAATANELKSLFAEGRAEIAGRQARDGVEFSRAVASLGTDRGIDAFTRFGFLKRSGKSFLATPLARVNARPHDAADLLRGIDPWLLALRRAAAGKGVPPRIPSALRRMDAAIVDYCRYGGAPRFRSVVTALGAMERELALVRGGVGDRAIRPVPLLSPDWIGAAYDGSAEFRIALSIASITSTAPVGPLRAHLEGIAEQPGKRIPQVTWIERGRSVVWRSARLGTNLTAVLERRLLEGVRASLDGLPLQATTNVEIADVARFLAGETDDRRIEDCLWGLALIDRSGPWPTTPSTCESAPPLPRAYSLLKLLVLPPRSALRSRTDDRPLRPEPSILTLLRSGNVDGACEVAARRLRASGYVPMPGPGAGGRKPKASFSGGVAPIRLAAALLIPISRNDVGSLCDLVLRRAGHEAPEGR